MTSESVMNRNRPDNTQIFNKIQVCTFYDLDGLYKITE